ncbi:MAG: DNA-binding protein, partial [Firmicutes bacterium]|nr:DNA-binding protein [Bacillota bacterium]
MDEITKQSLLYDCYGQLLTQRQREVYELYTQENYSLSEIAAELGISRQGV